MNREDYMLLRTKLHVRKVLFELGLLSVHQRFQPPNKVFLGPRNGLVATNALRLLRNKVVHEETSERLANKYLSPSGFGNIVSDAGTTVGEHHHRTIRRFLARTFRRLLAELNGLRLSSNPPVWFAPFVNPPV